MKTDSSDLTKYTINDLCQEIIHRRDCIGIRVFTRSDADRWSLCRLGLSHPKRHALVEKALEGVGTIRAWDAESFDKYMEHCLEEVEGGARPPCSSCPCMERHKENTRRTDMKTFLVEVHWDVAKVHRVEAESPQAAEEDIQKKMANGEISYLDEGYSTTDDNSALVAGEVTKDGVRWY